MRERVGRELATDRGCFDRCADQSLSGWESEPPWNKSDYTLVVTGKDSPSVIAGQRVPCSAQRGLCWAGTKCMPTGHQGPCINRFCETWYMYMDTRGGDVLHNLMPYNGTHCVYIKLNEEHKTKLACHYIFYYWLNKQLNDDKH